MVSQGRTVGVIEVSNSTPPGRGDLKLLGLAACQVGLAIDNARLFEQAHQGAITDQLTGLYNSAEFNRRLSEELERSRRHQQPVSVLMIDADQFQEINRTVGYLQGDLVLARVGELIKRTLRTTDLAARYGGDEFLVILPDTEPQGAAAAAENLRTALEREQIKLDSGGSPVRLTLSVGMASCPGHATTVEALLDAAARAVARAKQAGGNCVKCPG